MIKIYPATLLGLVQMEFSEPNMRELQKLSMAGMDYQKAYMWLHLNQKSFAYNDDKLICFWGFEGHNLTMLFSKGLTDKDVPLSFYKACKQYIKGKDIAGYVLCENTFAVRLVRFLGFKLSDPFMLCNGKFMKFSR